MTPVILGLLALLLAGPVPRLLLKTPRLRQVPRSAMVLWQACALAAVLAAFGAILSFVTDNALRSHPSALRWAMAAFASAVMAVVVTRLLWTAHRTGVRLRALRRRHRVLVDLLGADDAGVRILEVASPMAYCLPGLRSRVVVSKGAVMTLGDVQLSAVLAHERAHLRARHDLVLEAFSVLNKAFPRFVFSAPALGEVRLLVEVLADRVAVRLVGPRPVASALVTMASGLTPEAALGVGGTALVERVELMRDQRPHRVLALLVYGSALLVLAIPTVFVAYPWLAALPH